MSHKKTTYKKGRSMDLAHTFLRYFFQTEYMHYGYWLPEDSLDFLHLKQAQTRYVDQLLDMIPADVKSILDVGCGSGEIARTLISRGFEADVVAPPCMMTNIAAQKLQGQANVYRCIFQELDVKKKYDLILFSESFQFVPLREAMEGALKYSKKYILIADFFKKKHQERSPIGGGHQYEDFLSLARASRLLVLKNLDVTQYTVPHIDLEQDMVKNFVIPIREIMQRIYRQNNSKCLRFLVKILAYLNRKRIHKIQVKYLDNPKRNSAAFLAHKTYRFMLLGQLRNGSKVL